MSSPQPPVIYPAPGEHGPVLYLNPYSGTYTSSKSYGLRMQRGFAQGVPQVVARRGTMPGGVSESEQRRLRFLERWGFEERLWRRWQRLYVNEINGMASPSAQITRSHIQQVLANTPVTGLGVEWVEQRLREKLADMHDFRNHRRQRGPSRSGYQHFWQEAGERMVTPIEFWWYH